MTTHTEPDVALTAEGAQEMAPRDIAGGVEVLREVGSVLRMSEADVAALGDVEPDPDEADDHHHEHGAAAPLAPTACSG